MTQIWGLSGILSGREFKITRITMLRELMEKVDNMQEQMSNVSIYNSKEELKENARNQKHHNEKNNNAFNGHISTLLMAKEGISEFKDVSTNFPN